MESIVMKVQRFSKRRLLFLFGMTVFSGSLGISLVSCYPGDDISSNQTDIVATVPDQSADFSTKLTWARPPNVCAVSDPQQTGCDNPSNLNASTEQQILGAIDQNMAGMGFMPAGAGNNDPTLNPSQADVQVLPFATKTTWAGSACYPYYWGGWYGGYGWCYPYTYTFTTGTIMIVMLVTNSQNSAPIWSAGINGLLEGSTTSQINQRVNNTINQAFKQSPYLAAGK